MQITDKNVFVVYDIRSTMEVGPVPGRSHLARTMYRKLYTQAGFARRACDKFNQKHLENGPFGYGPGPYGWCSLEHYRTRVVRMVERTNLLSGKKYMEPSNTPGYCSPSSEAYWSM